MAHAINPGEDLKDSAVAVKDAVVDLAGETRRYATHRANLAKESASEMLDTVKTKAGDYNDTVLGFIKQNPYKSLAIAAGIGLAAGFMLRRR